MPSRIGSCGGTIPIMFTGDFQYRFGEFVRLLWDQPSIAAVFEKSDFGAVLAAIR